MKEELRRSILDKVQKYAEHRGLDARRAALFAAIWVNAPQSGLSAQIECIIANPSLITDEMLKAFEGGG